MEVHGWYTLTSLTRIRRLNGPLYLSSLPPMNDVKSALAWLVCGMVLLGGRIFGATPQISASSPTGEPGGTVMIAVSFITETNVSAVNFDLTFSTAYLSCAPPVLGGALSDHIMVSSQPSPGVRRVQIFSFAGTPLSGGVLVFLPVMVATNAPDHDEVLSLTNVGNAAVANSAGGVLAISPRPGFTSIAPVTDGIVRLRLSGSGNRRYVIEAATNLSSPQWTALETNSPVNGTLVFEDTAAGAFPVRFYRATLAR